MRLFITLLAAILAYPQQAPAPTHPTSTPYTGDLSVFEDPARDQKLQIDRVMDTLGLHAGSTVADIGAGSGYHTFRLATEVGDKGKVYAVTFSRRC